MKVILLSIKPQHMANILNGIKTLEIRKRFPKDYVGWVYIYCTKGKPYIKECKGFRYVGDKEISNQGYYINGKVVARFWCDKVEYVENTYDEFRWGEEDYNTETLNPDALYEKSCLSFEEMDNYLKGDYGYAIHITELEIFNKPKEISEFYTTRLDKQLPELFDNSIQLENGTWVKPLSRAPQSFMFIEIE